jgi:lambda repressor-like predicted transcriptional regulator
MESRVETFEQIRHDRDREGLSIRALAARHGVHRRAVRQALGSPVPPVEALAGGQAGAEAGALSGGGRFLVGGRS